MQFEIEYDGDDPATKLFFEGLKLEVPNQIFREMAEGASQGEFLNPLDNAPSSQYND